MTFPTRAGGTASPVGAVAYGRAVRVRERRQLRRVLAACAVGLAAALTWWFGAGGTDSGRSLPGPAGEDGWRVTRVIDGDTVDVRRDGVVERVRLLGIDTPERDQCGYAAAKDLITELVTGREVTLVEGSRDDRDRYDRLLRYVEVTVDGEVVDVGLRQLEAGLAAEVYDSRTGYPRHDREDAYVAADEASPDVCPDLREH